MGYRIIN